MEMGLVLLLLAAALVLFISERLPAELVSLLVLAALLLVAVAGPATGWVNPERWITPGEALSGFGNSAVVTVAAMFVLSAGLARTGALAGLGRALVRLGRNQTALLVVMMVVVGVASAFVNNTAAVAVFLPLVLTACHRRKLPPSRVLIPLSFASQFGGVCTLIGTSTNLLVSAISEKAGYGAFGMFEFSQLGVILLGVGLVYLLVVGPWLLPARRGTDLAETYRLREYITEVRVLPDSPLIGKTVVESRLGERHDANVLEILRQDRRIWSPHDTRLQAGDILLVQANVQNLMDLRARTGLTIEPEFQLKDATLSGDEMALTEALVAPRSTLAGRTLAEAYFRWRYEAIVLALQRQGRLLRGKLARVRLRFGDALLLLLRRQDLPRLRASDDLVVLAEVEAPSLRSGRALLALGIITLVVLAAALGVVPILVSAILGALAMVLTRCLTMDQAFQAIDWRVIFCWRGSCRWAWPWNAPARPPGWRKPRWDWSVILVPWRCWR